MHEFSNIVALLQTNGDWIFFREYSCSTDTSSCLWILAFSGRGEFCATYVLLL